MLILRNLREWETFRRGAGAGGGHVLAPTMGALHEGHAALIRRGVAEARERGLAGGCIVWVFVNPTQFNSAADLARYPRTLEADARVSARAGASAVFAPGVEDVYPPGVTIAAPALPEAATRPGLEDAFRPGHFAGVCQVVKRMFEMCRPSAAVFGEKDWQQLQVVRALVAQERMGIEIIPEATVREPDGLAMSSRNVFLSAAERARALAISRALREIGGAINPDDDGAPLRPHRASATFPAGSGGGWMAAEVRMREVLASAGITPEYAVVRDAETLGAPAPGRPSRALIAAMVGATRLIDNAAWPA